ncbi:ABC transporter substrate-binding protein [Roseococcus sp. SDR]|uniref:ABC transporter substrate-binding protein n=1 Tax=Roseococcus sp. SDR TaxID=2835532 RepID=UPI001BCE38C2|nr:ABC transporter substrate-binding protein [Roseococcus sp. SDR]MBS7792942.1 ABC transporter substrate-binding protein [Roseococcus sp. SDR]MBV1848256.1 ABC transporter substrate-binding protein [Roseococcus sp. SDR]
MTGFTTGRRALLGGLAATPFLREASAQGNQPYVLGTLFPMSGPNAEYGTAFTAGIQLAMQHIAADNMLRRPLRLQAEDTQALPQQGVIGMTKLVNVDRANYVMVGFTAVSKAVAPVGDRAKTVMVNGGAVGPDLAGLSPFFWNVIPLAHLETQALLPFLVRQRNLKRIALVYVDDPLGDAILGILRTALPAAGGELAGQFSIPRTAQQFAPVAARIRQTRPDAVYIASFGAQQSQIIKQLRDNGVSQPLVSYSAMNIDSVRATAEAEGLIFTTQVTDFAGGDAVTRRFATDFRARFNSDPGTYQVNYYNAARLFGLLAQSLERENAEVNGENLRRALLAGREFDLVGGKGRFDDQGNMSAELQINEIRGGRSVKIG